MQIELAYERRIEAADVELGESLDLKRRRDEWRAEAESAIQSLAARLHGKGGVDAAADNELESFRIKPCPRNDRFGSSPQKRWEEEVEKARRTRDRALGRLEGVKADKDGMLSLTVNMLREWFSL